MKSYSTATVLKPFEINFSVNCENAVGTTQEITVDPKKVIEHAGQIE